MKKYLVCFELYHDPSCEETVEVEASNEKKAKNLAEKQLKNEGYTVTRLKWSKEVDV